MSFVGADKDMFGHAKLGGMGEQVSRAVKDLSPRFNAGRRIDMISMNLSYLVRSGDPDPVDSIVPMAWGNLAVQLLAKGVSGKLVALRNGRYEAVDLGTVTAYKRIVDVDRYYDTERYRPTYASFELQPMFGIGVED
jgi:6-phosphofructokinase 1